MHKSKWTPWWRTPEGLGDCHRLASPMKDKRACEIFTCQLRASPIRDCVITSRHLWKTRELAKYCRCSCPRVNWGVGSPLRWEVQAHGQNRVETRACTLPSPWLLCILHAMHCLLRPAYVSSMCLCLFSEDAGHKPVVLSHTDSVSWLAVHDVLCSAWVSLTAVCRLRGAGMSIGVW